MTEDDYQRLDREAAAEVEAAVVFAESAPPEAVGTLTRHVYAGPFGRGG
jgi:TPP-dependent pyruvate/acetoin dehydrogenase alpha subunit